MAVGGAVETGDVGFTYDAAGNRQRMTDGQGAVDYSYDPLSRLTWERRSFHGLGGTYQLTYGYNLAGHLTSIQNQWGSQVSYTRDHVGQVTGIQGAGGVSAPTYASNLRYRAFGALRTQTSGNNHQLQMQYDSRMRLTRWDMPTIAMGASYEYQHFGENTGRVTFARNLYDSTLDRSYSYDRQGRLISSYSGAEARAHIGQGQWGIYDGPYAHEYYYDQWGNMTTRNGWGGENASYTLQFDGNNRRVGSSYDAAGNITSDGGQTFQYDVTGQQTFAAHTNLQQGYDGDRLRVRRTENGVTTYFLRSTILGGQVVAEINSSGGWERGYVYDGGGSLLAIQQSGQVEWTHQDPVTKSQRLTNQSGQVTAWYELEPWGSETARGNGQSFRQPRRFTSYTRDLNSSDEAMHRRYNRWWQRFDQPDPYDGSYDLSDPQSLNRYAYVNNDPVNFVDPSGLCPEGQAEVIDPVTGEATCVPTYDESVTVRADPFEGMWGWRPERGVRPPISPELPPPSTPPTSGPPTSETPGFVREFYARYQGRLAYCLQKIFGADASRLGKQTIRNAPSVVANLNIQRLTALAGGGDLTLGTINADLGRRGTIYIASEIVADTSPLGSRRRFGTYVHELGNILDSRLNPKGRGARERGYVYGDSDAIDRDTGQQLGTCKK